MGTRNYKSFLLLSMLLFFSTMAKAHVVWYEYQTGVEEALYNVCCIDDQTVFVCGQNGVILKTIDGGVHWEEKYRRNGCQMTELCFVDANVGYAICDSIIDECSHQWFLVKTCDGGETWDRVGESVFSFIGEYYYGVPLLVNQQYVRSEMVLDGPDNLFVAVSYDGIYKSTDGGLTLGKQAQDFAIYETRGFFVQDNVGYLLWKAGYWEPEEEPAGVAKTTDYGETWTLMESVSDVTSGVLFARFFSKDHIRLFNYDCILDTYDGFETFETSGVISLLCCAFEEEYIKAKFTSRDIGIAMAWTYDCYLGVSRGVSYTKNNGLSWTNYSGYDIPSFRFYDIDGVDSTFFISCDHGRVLKNLQFTPMSNEETSAQTIVVRPNPMKDVAYIEGVDILDVSVYNFFGQLVKTIRATNEIDMKELKEGVYLLQITDTEGKTRKAKVIKT